MRMTMMGKRFMHGFITGLNASACLRRPAASISIWVIALAMAIAFASPAQASSVNVDASFTGTSGTINFTAYPSPSFLEGFINSDGTSIGSSVPVTVGAVSVNGIPIGSLFGATANLTLNNTDAMPAATVSGSTITQMLGGTGTFSLSYMDSGTSYTFHATTSGTGGYVDGTLGGSTANIVLLLTNFSDPDPAVAPYLSIFNGSTMYLDISGTLAGGGVLTEDTCAPTFCVTPGEEYLGSFDLDYSVSLSSTPPSGTPAPSSTPEPGTLALFGSGFIGAAGLLRRRLTRSGEDSDRN